MTYGSLFTGIGGFDLGFNRAKHKALWMCERDKHCIRLLNSKFPGIPIYKDIKDFLRTDLLGNLTRIQAPEIIIGGDPCPAHSNAKANKESSHPDLSGYFLAVVGRFSPKWVVRENVPSPVTIDNFAIALEALGYSTHIIWAQSSDFVPQNRERSFVIGCASKTAFQKFLNRNTSTKMCRQSMQSRNVFACLCSNDYGLTNVWDNYIYKPSQGLRSLSNNEREYIAGFPNNWTSEFSKDVRYSMCGNAVTPQVAEEIALGITQASKNISWEVPDIQKGIDNLLAKFLI